MHLPSCTSYDPGVISHYITSVLRRLNIDNAYGLLAGIKEYGGPVVPTLIFGIPPPNILPVIQLPTPYRLPTLVQEDWIVLDKNGEAMWQTEPVHDEGRVTLKAISVGVEGLPVLGTWRKISDNRVGCSDMAGSFGGFLRKTASPDLLFGITAAHCLPETDLGTPISSPSTLEITGRLKELLRYTTLYPTVNHVQVNEVHNTEVKSLLKRFHFMDNLSGISFLDPAAQFEPKKGVLTGSRVGHVVCSRVGNYQGLLHDYDQQLAALGHDIFKADPFWETRMDWSIFSCDPARYSYSNLHLQLFYLALLISLDV